MTLTIVAKLSIEHYKYLVNNSARLKLNAM